MSNKMYDIFCAKLPDSTENLLPGSKPLLVTFHNPYTIEINSDLTELYKQFDYIASDGILPITLLKVFGRKRKPRISFDMSSLAPHVFNFCITNNKKIYFIGSTDENINAFVRVVKEKFADLQIAGISNGFIKEIKTQKLEEIKNSGSDIVVIGMGSPLQDQIAVELRKTGYNGSIYTCGGFFHQTTEKIDYYPRWVNKLQLRAFYRMYKEPYVIKRLIKYYPKFTWSFIWYCMNKK